MSKYQLIYQELLNKIKSHEIKSNAYLPSENELMKIYDASRDTIRKSLSLLAQSGYIIKEKGKGSRVIDLDMINFPVSGVISFKELQKSFHYHVETVVHVFLEEEDNEEIKKHLYMDEGNIYHIERIRKFDGEKVILDIDYLNANIVKGLSIENARNSLYEYIEKELGLKISFAKKEITVVKATEEEKELLDLNNFDFLVCVKSYTYLEDATLFQYTISKHRPDKFRFVDFAKRSEM